MLNTIDLSLINALVAFKGKPALVVAQNTHKFELEFDDGSKRRVRQKDFRFIHAEFVQINGVCPQANLTILEEFQQECLTLQELTEWLFDTYTAQNAWCTYLMVEDGMHLYWQKDKVFVRPIEQVISIQAQRNQKIKEADSLQHCVDNLKKNIIDAQDLPHIQAIEKVFLNQSKHAKILDAIGVTNSPEAAHKLLLKLNYITPSFNPYPPRFNIPEDENIQVNAPKVNRIDLTHLHSFAIDNTESNDADDAISVDGNTVWVHIADVATIVASCSKLDAYGQVRISNLYLPEQVIHMLPKNVTKMCALNNTSSALSVGFEFDGSTIYNIQVFHSTIKVINITYDNADNLLDSCIHLSKLHHIAKAHKQYRSMQGAISFNLPHVVVIFKQGKVSITSEKFSPSREIVAELMVMAGHAVGKFAVKNEISMPYLVQDKTELPKQLLDNKDCLSLSQSFKAVKNFKRSVVSVKNLPHCGLGLDVYLRVTSPLRRYLDLLVHQQLSDFIAGNEILNKDKVKIMIGIYNATMTDVKKAIRASDEHFKCLYLMQNPTWAGTGVVVDILVDNKATLMIPDIGMVTQIKFKQLPKLDEIINLKIVNVNLVERLANFKTA